MKKLIISTVLVGTFFSFPLSAENYFSGQKEYLLQCRAKACHGGGRELASHFTIDRWTEILENEGNSLSVIHEKTADADEFREYLKSSRYQKKLRYLRSFVFHFAKDSKTQVKIF